MDAQPIGQTNRKGQTRTCAQFLRWGAAYTKYVCGKKATHWHPIFGEMCRDCAIDAAQDGAKRIKRIKDGKWPVATDEENSA